MRGHKDTCVNLVPLSYEDIPKLISLSASVGWDYDEHEIRTIMKSGKYTDIKTKKGKLYLLRSKVPSETLHQWTSGRSHHYGIHF